MIDLTEFNTSINALTSAVQRIAARAQDALDAFAAESMCLSGEIADLKNALQAKTDEATRAMQQLADANNGHQDAIEHAVQQANDSSAALIAARDAQIGALALDRAALHEAIERLRADLPPAS